MALVPARDEADVVADTVQALRSTCHEVMVIDDGSADDTAAVAVAAGARVVSSRGMGKGEALEQGIASVADPPAIWILADADLGASATGMEALLEPVRAGTCDLAIAVLPPQGGGFGAVKRAARSAIRLLSGFEASEPLSGQRVMTAEALDACRPLAAGFGVETAMTIDAARLGLRIREIPTDIRHRPTRRDVAGFVHRGRQGWDILRAVLTRALGIR